MSLNTTIMAHDAFEELTGKPLSDASNSDYDTAESNLPNSAKCSI